MQELGRRQFLGLGAGMLLAPPATVEAQSHRVGVGVNPDPYVATWRAVAAAGTWRFLGIAGRRVVIKPNVVSRSTPDTGIVTDPEVVRAVVDLALLSGAEEILIVETAPRMGENFTTAGYGFFESYDPRVSLVDLFQEPFSLAPVPGGYNYGAIHIPDLLVDPNIVFISVGKLKTHYHSDVSLTTKNLFGLPAREKYISFPDWGRFAMHDRGVQMSIHDLARIRPIHFAVIDGIWGMEGDGPLLGTPVRMDTVLAGLNAVAVDRVGLFAMSIPQTGVRHLYYQSSAGLGPAGLGEIRVVGDALSPRAFVRPQTAPVVDPPFIFPKMFQPDTGAQANIVHRYSEDCWRRVEVVRLSDDVADVERVRSLAPYGHKAAGLDYLIWDGRDDEGSLVPPGRYAIHITAFSLTAEVRPSDAISWVTVQ